MKKYGKLEAVIWDMDGVLLDSRLTHYQSFQAILGKLGLEIREDLFLSMFGAPNEDIINQASQYAFSEDEVVRMSIEKDQYFCKLIAEQAVYLPDVEKWLKQFSEDGIPQALASSGSWENINTIMDALHARQYFKTLVSGDDKIGKPDPYVFLQAAGDLGVRPESCLVVEDSQVGLQAAEAAGMKILAVATTNSPENLKKADLVLDDLTFLKDEMLGSLFEE